MKRPTGPPTTGKATGKTGGRRPRTLRNSVEASATAVRLPLTFLMPDEAPHWEWLSHEAGAPTAALRGMHSPCAEPGDLLICRLEDGTKATYRFLETSPVEGFPNQFVGIVECVELDN